MSASPTAKVTAQQYIDAHKLHSLLDGLVQPIVKRRDPRPLEALSIQAPLVTQGTPANAMALISAGSVTLNDLNSLDFDCFPYYNNGSAAANSNNSNKASSSTGSASSSSGALHGLVQKIFEGQGLLSFFKIDAPSFLQWVATVEANYHADNSFHNFLHAFNVLQTCSVFVTGIQRETGNGISKLEVFAMFVAALCHDLQHPGVTNKFLSQTNHPLALRYNDRAVLENHHAAVTLSLFFGPAVSKNASILKNMSPSDVQAFRTLVVDLILATDFGRHEGIVGQLNALLEKLGFMEKEKGKRLLNGTVPGVTDAKAAKLCFLQAIVKASDISNEARSYKFSQQWAPLVKEEFWKQGDMQKALGHGEADITASCDRLNEKTLAYYDQPAFIEHLCMPLYNTLERISPTVFGVASGNLKANNNKWKTQQPGYVGSPLTTSGSRSYASFGAPPGSAGGFGISPASGAASPIRGSSSMGNKPPMSPMRPSAHDESEESYESDEDEL